MSMGDERSGPGATGLHSELGLDEIGSRSFKICRSRVDPDTDEIYRKYCH
jgi:hypothetical protein